jgi:hypothetical protein
VRRQEGGETKNAIAVRRNSNEARMDIVTWDSRHVLSSLDVQVENERIPIIVSRKDPFSGHVRPPTGFS